MKRNAPLNGLLAITLSLSGFLFNPVQAESYTRYLTKVPGATSVDERQAEIQKRLREAVATGRLTTLRSQEFTKQLDKIADLEASYRASHGKLSLWENLKLLFELDKLSRKIEQSLSDRLVADLKFGDRINLIDKRIGDGLSSHRLTSQEASGLKYDLNRIKTSYTAFGGNRESLSDSQALQLAIDLDRLSNRLETTMHDRQIELPEIDKAQAELVKKIDAGIASKKLTASEAKDLKAVFQTIADKEAKLKGFGRPLTSQESLNLAIDLEKLSREIDLQLRDEEVEAQDFASKKNTVAYKIASGVLTGKLTLPEANYLKDGLDKINSQEATWTKSEGKLTSEERKSLLLSLEKLAISLERRLFDQRYTWGGASKTIANLQDRIEKARSSGRISQSDQGRLSKELDKIKANWNSIREKDKYSLNESVFVVQSLEDLNQNLAETLRDRDVVIPKLEQRKNQVDQRIAVGVVSGRLTSGEGQRLLDQFDVITERESVYRASKKEISDRQRLALALMLERLSAKVERAIHEGNRFNPSFEQLKDELKEDIKEGIIAGKVTEEEAEKFSSELDRVDTMEKGFRGTSSDLTATQALTIAQNLESLKESVRTEVSVVDASTQQVEKRKGELAQRISEGVTSGKLSKNDASILRKEFQSIHDLTTRYAASGGMSQGEAQTVAYKLEKLGSLIEQKMHDEKISLPSLASLHKKVDSRLAKSIAGGAISLDDSKDFKRSLENIARMEMSFRYSGDGLSYPESMMLATRLNQLNQEIDNKLAGKSPSFTGIDDRIDSTAKRIADGVNTRKLATDKANSLKKELDRISSAKVAFAHSQGGFNLEETETLVRDLDRLNSEIDLRMKGQKFAWSDIDRRQSSLEYKLNLAIKSGKLKGSDKDLLVSQLDKIKRAKSAFTMSDGNLNFFERVSLGEALDRFDQLMKSTVK